MSSATVVIGAVRVNGYTDYPVIHVLRHAVYENSIKRKEYEYFPCLKCTDIGAYILKHSHHAFYRLSGRIKSLCFLCNS